MSFLAEIKRRNVARITLAYAAVGWLVIQVSTSVEEPLGLPSWFDTLVIVLVLIGFPIALLLAWAFELTPDGIRSTAKLQQSTGAGKPAGRALNYVVIVALAIAVLLLGYDRFGDRRIETSPTLAVLPFTADASQAAFALGLSEELANTLDDVPDLTVKGTPVSLQGSALSHQELGKVLGAYYLLSGNLVSVGEKLRVQANLTRADNGERLWSRAFDRTIAVGDLFMMMDELVVKVADALQVSLGVGIGSRRGMTRNVDAYNAYFEAIALAPVSLRIGDAISSIDTALRYDDEFALAWVLKADLHYVRAMQAPGDEADGWRDTSLAAARRAIELEPEMGEAHGIIAEQSARQADWRGAAAEFETAWALSPTPTVARDYALLLRILGRLDVAEEILRTSLDVNRLDRDVHNGLILTLGEKGQLREANAVYAMGLELFVGQGYSSLTDVYISMSRLGSDETNTETDPVATGLADGVYAVAFRNRDDPQAGLAAIRQWFAERASPSLASTQMAMVWLAYFGDTGAALDLLKRQVESDPTLLHTVWVPLLRDVRQTEGFRQLLRDVGLVDYWTETGWPDICQPTADDFSCD